MSCAVVRRPLVAAVGCLLLLLPGTARGQHPPGPEVLEVIGALGDVRDVAVLEDRGDPGGRATLLLATSGGLARHDRRGSPTVVPVRGLPGARLRSVSVLRDGSGRARSVWLGGVEGLARLEPGALRVVTATYPLRRVTRVAWFGGAVWAATYGRGLFRKGPGDTAFRSVSVGRRAVHRRITDLLVVDGSLWVGTAGAGVVRLGADGAVRSRVRRGLPDPLVWALSPGTGGEVLVSTAQGLGVAAGATGEVLSQHPAVAASRRLRVRDVRGACVSEPSGRVWLASFGGDLVELVPRGGTLRPTRRARGPLAPHALSCDAVGGVWLGHKRGLLRGSGRRPVALGAGGLPSADVTSLARAFGSVWVGTFDRGLARVRGGRVEAVDHAATRWGVDRRINDLAVTRRGGATRLWIATDRGLFWHDGRRFSQDEEPGAPGSVHVTSLHVDRSGALWVTSSRSLNRYRDGQWSAWTGTEELPVVHLHAVTTDAQGRVWVGSLHGLYRLDLATGRFERRGTATGDLPVDWVTALVPWGQGIVAGTYHGGLAIEGGRGDFTIVRARDAGGDLPAGWVNPHALVTLGHDRLLVGTLARGLVVGRPGGWRHLTTRDGLPSDDVTDFLPNADGSVWVATRGGLARLRLLR